MIDNDERQFLRDVLLKFAEEEGALYAYNVDKYVDFMLDFGKAAWEAGLLKGAQSLKSRAAITAEGMLIERRRVLDLLKQQEGKRWSEIDLVGIIKGGPVNPPTNDRFTTLYCVHCGIATSHRLLSADPAAKTNQYTCGRCRSETVVTHEYLSINLTDRDFVHVGTD